MAQNFRHSEILTLAREAGKVTVEGLAAHFNVTAQTIRRDLGELCDVGLAELAPPRRLRLFRQIGGRGRTFDPVHVPGAIHSDEC